MVDLREPPIDYRRLARSYYWRGWPVDMIAAEIELIHGELIPEPTIRSWKKRDKWDEAPMLTRVEEALERRYITLVELPKKEGHQLKELDALGRQITAMFRARKYQESGKESDLNPAIANRNAGPKKKVEKNHLTEAQIEQLLDAFDQGLFQYQKGWREVRPMLAGSTALATRFILKSRQIGATFYFAREAFARALETGNNQIFISASRNQANIFREYIVDFVVSVTGVQLTGSPIILDLDGVVGPDGEAPKLYFLGTNYRTAQGYHGDVYLDEVFWVHGFEQIWKVASAMASQARYRVTLFSTPSVKSHDAYRLWTGERFNAGRKKGDKVEIVHEGPALTEGVLGHDGIWRQVVTIDDAIAGGCDLFVLEKLLLSYSDDEIDQLFRCQFLDDKHSMFPFALLRGCMVDSWEKWEGDFDAFALSPYGDREVWIGYDPQESAAGDDGCCVVVAPPLDPKGKFRILEKHRWKGLDFQEQATKLLELRERYNVGKISIDTTGIGAAVWQVVVRSFPTAQRIDYSVPVKTAMVLKAKNVMTKKRLEFDTGWVDVAASFMSIRAELTPNQRQVTYVASRSGDTGHADVAWAIMHALYNEPLDETPVAGSSTMEII